MDSFVRAYMACATRRAFGALPGTARYESSPGLPPPPAAAALRICRSLAMLDAACAARLENLAMRYECVAHTAVSRRRASRLMDKILNDAMDVLSAAVQSPGNADDGPTRLSLMAEAVRSADTQSAAPPEPVGDADPKPRSVDRAGSIDLTGAMGAGGASLGAQAFPAARAESVSTNASSHVAQRYRRKKNVARYLREAAQQKPRVYEGPLFDDDTEKDAGQDGKDVDTGASAAEDAPRRMSVSSVSSGRLAGSSVHRPAPGYSHEGTSSENSGRRLSTASEASTDSARRMPFVSDNPSLGVKPAAAEPPASVYVAPAPAVSMLSLLLKPQSTAPVSDKPAAKVASKPVSVEAALPSVPAESKPGSLGCLVGATPPARPGAPAPTDEAIEFLTKFAETGDLTYITEGLMSRTNTRTLERHMARITIDSGDGATRAADTGRAAAQQNSSGNTLSVAEAHAATRVAEAPLAAGVAPPQKTSGLTADSVALEGSGESRAAVAHQPQSVRLSSVISGSSYTRGGRRRPRPVDTSNDLPSSMYIW